MADHPRRPDPDKPRVDDFFLDTPGEEGSDPDRPQVPAPDQLAPDQAAPDQPAPDQAEQDQADADKAVADEVAFEGDASLDHTETESTADGPTADGPTADEPTADGTDGGGDGTGHAGAERHTDSAVNASTVADEHDPDRSDSDEIDPDGAPEERSFAGPPSSGRWRGVVGRSARTLAVVGVAGALVYGAASGSLNGVDLASALDRDESVVVPPGRPGGLAVVSESAIGCLGPDLVGLADPTVPEPDQTVAVAVGSAPPEALGDGIDPAATGEILLTGQPDGGTARSEARSETATLEATGATWVRGTATGGLAPGFGGAQVGLGLEEQQRGLSMASCGPAVDDAWFVAGGAQAGRAERLILANPTGNPVTVDVEVLGAEGPVAVVGGRGIVVAPGAREVVLLDALAPGEARPVAHLTTTGGPVLAALGDRWLEGTLDRGTELTTATAPPDTTLVIPAVPGPRPGSGDVSSVRVGVPGAEQAVVQIRALTADGPVRVDNGVTNVDAGTVAEIDVSDLPEGTQSIEVVADTPVVAAAQVVRRGEADGVGELAWVPAVTPSTGLVGLPLVDAGEEPLVRELTVASVEGAMVEIITVTEDRTHVQPVDIPAGGSRALEISSAGQSLWVRTVEGSTSSVLLSSTEDELGTLIAGTVLPETPQARAVRAVAPWLP